LINSDHQSYFYSVLLRINKKESLEEKRQADDQLSTMFVKVTDLNAWLIDAKTACSGDILPISDTSYLQDQIADYQV